MSRDYSEDLRLAHRLADAADEICLDCLERGSSDERRKSDGSPVTAADLEIESAIKSLIAAERPEDRFCGEESFDPSQGVSSDRPTWIVDPIDHTRHFIRGSANYAFLATLFVDGLARVAIVSAPSLGHRWTATRGAGADRNGAPMRVSQTRKLDEAHVAFAGHREWVDRRDWCRVSALMDNLAYVCGTAGGFLPAMRVAAGELDAFVEPWGALWDHAPLRLIVEEAGGRATNLDGGEASGDSLLVSNGILHDELLGRLA